MKWPINLWTSAGPPGRKLLRAHVVTSESAQPLFSRQVIRPAIIPPSSSSQEGGRCSLQRPALSPGQQNRIPPPTTGVRVSTEVEEDRSGPVGHQRRAHSLAERLPVSSREGHARYVPDISCSAIKVEMTHRFHRLSRVQAAKLQPQTGTREQAKVLKVAKQVLSKTHKGCSVVTFSVREKQSAA